MSSLLETLQTQARLASSTSGHIAEDLHAFFDIMSITAGHIDERVLAWVQTQNALINDATAAWQWMLENSDQVVAGYLISIPGAVGEPGAFDETTGTSGTIATATTDLPDLGSGFQWGIYAGSDARIGVVSTATGQGNTMGITTSSAIYSGDSANFTVTVTNGVKTLGFVFTATGTIAAAVTTTFLSGNDLVDNASATKTWAGLSLGTAASDRKIIVGITRRIGTGTLVINSVTVGGVSATQIASFSITSGYQIAFFGAAVPTGTTGDVVVNVAEAGVGRISVMLWRTVGLQSFTATDTKTDNTISSRTLSVSLNVSAKGAGFAATYFNQGNLATTVWSGLGEDYSTASSDSGARVDGAHTDFATAQTGLSVSEVYTISTIDPTIGGMLAIALR